MNRRIEFEKHGILAWAARHHVDWTRMALTMSNLQYPWSIFMSIELDRTCHPSALVIPPSPDLVIQLLTFPTPQRWDEVHPCGNDIKFNAFAIFTVEACSRDSWLCNRPCLVHEGAATTKGSFLCHTPEAAPKKPCASFPTSSFFLANTVSAIVLRTSGRWIIDSAGKRVKLRCVSWAGHMETNIPEGLQHQPAGNIAQWIASNRFNCVRLTYAIDMALNPDRRVSDSFTAAASPAGVSTSAMQTLYNQAVSKNSWLSSSTVRGAFARVIQELDQRGVMVILDNHNSRASWCCGTGDGNGWWSSASGYNADNSRYFDTNNWINGLRNMASFANSHPNVVGMSLRNELRAVGSQDGNNHADWYNLVGQGANAVRGANQNVLIVIGGVSYATELGYIYGKPFNKSNFPDKLVYEFHNYQWTFGKQDCTQHQKLMGDKAGYLLTQNQAYTGPLFLSEFGWNQNSATADEVAYTSCLVKYMENNDAEWAYWALMGSYYVREGKVNFDESFGVLNSDWSGWRNSNFTRSIGRMFDVLKGLSWTYWYIT
ncbi:glycoside hydrolase superfamily [Coprinopsis sp. MPI-PUGE-AT-0042]|nr:glycoside hydrolase superfamily [Coprinopsis sp. MPI-PUGE-AT-0042]